MAFPNSPHEWTKATEGWMQKFGKTQTYPDAFAFRGALASSLIMPDDATEIRRIGPVLLVMPGKPGQADLIRPGAVLELEPDDHGRPFSVTLSRSQVEKLVEDLPAHKHEPVQIELVDGHLVIGGFDLDLKIPVTYPVQRMPGGKVA